MTEWHKNYPFVNFKGETKSLKETRGPLILREDGRVERLCTHGVGHPIGHLVKWDEWMGIHGCCDQKCCSKWVKD